jgi:predicted nucleotidyltransferase
MFQQFWKIFEAAEIERDQLKGGEGDKLRPEDVNPKELRKGIQHEMEHTEDPDVAEEIALDHLAEDPLYYTHLDRMEREVMKLEVRLKLKRIANAFLRDHNIDPDAVEDIYFTGSLAGYNYHPDSDIDLHIVVDFSKVNQDLDMVRDLFNSRRLVWNERHNITIFGHEVEIYIEDVDEVYDDEDRPVYSLTKDRWINPPKRLNKDFDYNSAMKKAQMIMHQVGLVQELMNQEKFVEAKRQATRIFAKLKRMRKAGLQREGAYSPENIAFKILRKQGYIDQLGDLKSASFDRMMSLPQ